MLTQFDFVYRDYVKHMYSSNPSFTDRRSAGHPLSDDVMFNSRREKGRMMDVIYAKLIELSEM